MSKEKAQVTVETAGILKAVEQGAKSLTAIAKMLGYKSGSSGVLKKIIQTVPDIQSRLDSTTANGVENQGETKPVVKKTATPAARKKPLRKAAFPVPECCPYRHSDNNITGYAMLFSILHHFRGTGIGKSDLLKHYRAWSGKTAQHALYDLTVVTSPREDGSAHRSASKAADAYFVQRENDHFTLHLYSEAKGK